MAGNREENEGKKLTKEQEIEKQKLRGELERSENDLIEHFANNQTVMDDCMKLIEKARCALEEDALVEVAVTVDKLKARIKRAENSHKVLQERWANFISLFWKIFLYNLLFMAIALYIGYQAIFGPCAVASAPDGKLPPLWLASWFILTFAAGMLGGTLISFYGLARHSAEGNFDKSYVKWYWCKPFIGALSGSIAAIPFLAGLFIFNVNADKNILVASIASVAFLAGYYERFFLKLVDRLGEVILSPGESKKTEEK